MHNHSYLCYYVSVPSYVLSIQLVIHIHTENITEQINNIGSNVSLIQLRSQQSSQLISRLRCHNKITVPLSMTQQVGSYYICTAPYHLCLNGCLSPTAKQLYSCMISKLYCLYNMLCLLQYLSKCSYILAACMYDQIVVQMQTIYFYVHRSKQVGFQLDCYISDAY